ncbi:putative bifunctional diguanylate cyclase/phosphodiesterase [Pseudomonas rhizophila]|uniref:putative bifunctional diguanylate cyclase/phosphodiesterase n=1 Tax=Pseudomonas rhizophila TaxID=2045200 RepID=UPI0030DDA883
MTLQKDINRRILLIEDELATHRTMRLLLNSCDDRGAVKDSINERAAGGADQQSQYSVDSTCNRADALEIVRKARDDSVPYALIISSVRMFQGCCGLEILEELWKTDPNVFVALSTEHSTHSWGGMDERIEHGDQLIVFDKPLISLDIRLIANTMTRKWQLVHNNDKKMRVLELTIEKRVQELVKISRMLHYDALTELPNGTLLNDRLTQALAQCRRYRRRLAVMFLGLDRFKRINNAFGHETGDELLKQVGSSLANAVRASDSVFRYGSDEFVVLLIDMGEPQQAKCVAMKLLAAVSSPCVIEDEHLSITASLGISLYPTDGIDAITLIKQAETAMRSVKEGGPNDYRFYTEDINRQARHRQTIESGLRLALQRGEFVLHYQPKLELSNGKVVGAEALVRWMHPDRGLVYPADFIAIAEETGLMQPLSLWVLREACQQICLWQTEGWIPIKVSVNISPVDFRQRGFIDGVKEVLNETRIDPTLLEFEITESVLMQNVETTNETLKAIKSLGVRLAIDDFGTGYSSLSYLQKFPVDVLKIDRSFVSELNVDAEISSGTNLVGAIISLGKNLSLRVIAEGVETVEQLTCLNSLKCDEAQGYFFSKPLKADCFVRWVDLWEKKRVIRDGLF